MAAVVVAAAEAELERQAPAAQTALQALQAPQALKDLREPILGLKGLREILDFRVTKGLSGPAFKGLKATRALKEIRVGKASRDLKEPRACRESKALKEAPSP